MDVSLADLAIRQQMGDMADREFELSIMDGTAFDIGDHGADDFSDEPDVGPDFSTDQYDPDTEEEEIEDMQVTIEGNVEVLSEKGKMIIRSVPEPKESPQVTRHTRAAMKIMAILPHVSELNHREYDFIVHGLPGYILACNMTTRQENWLLDIYSRFARTVGV